MKKQIFLLVAFMLCSFLFSDVIIQDYHFEFPELNTENGFTEIIYENCYNSGEEGNPLLPYFGADVLLPQNQQIKTVRIISQNYYSTQNDLTIKPASKQFPISQKIENYEVKPDETVYNSLSRFPEKTVNNVSTNFLSGHSIGSFSICPINYIPGKKQIKFLKDIQIEITYETSAISTEQFLKNSYYIQKRITNIVDNPHILSSYNYPSNRDEEYDILLITNAELLPYFQDYIDFKTSIGFIVETITTEEIYSNYSGIDEQEKIRNCVIDYYLNFSIGFVILGGDSVPNDPSQNVIPHRGFYAVDDNNIPSDMYYACLDRGPGTGTGPDWNNDGDNRWGEPEEYDLFAEVGIGRICVDDETEIQNFTSKLYMYQNNPVIDDIEKTLMIGEELNNSPWTYGGDYKDEIAYGSSNHGFTTTAISDNFTISTLYDRDMTWDKYDVFDQFNNTGINLLNHLGHSSPTYNMKMNNSDITTSNLTNDGITRGFVIGYSQGCYNGSFDNWHWNNGYGEDCFAEKITTLETGEVACVSNSRYGWYIPGNTNSTSQFLDRQFYDAIFGEDITIIGFTNSDSKEDNMSYFTSNDYMRYTAYETNLFGDPSLDIWTAVPEEIVAIYPPSVLIGTEQISFVTDTPFARIALMQDGELIGRGVADETGSILIDLFSCITSTESIELSIIGHNKIRLQDSITIFSNQPYVIFESYEIDDTAGNGNGLADFDEDIELNITLNNIGDMDALNVSATLSTEDEYITLTDDFEEFGTIPAENLLTLNNAFAFTIADNIPDQHEILFDIEISGSARETWYSSFVIIVNAPVWEIGQMQIDDSQGNNDGILDPGESANILFPTTNIGHSTSPFAYTYLNCDNELITIYNYSFEIGEVEPGIETFAVYVVSADAAIPIGTPIMLNYEVSAQAYNMEENISTTLGLVKEDFETGNFSSYSWQFSGNADWVIDTDAYEGLYCGKSGTIDHNMTSSLVLTLDVMYDGEISFYRKTSCEDVGSVTGNYYDYLAFFIDGEEMDKWAGETPWDLVTFEVTSGNHVFEWLYNKDQGVVSGSDCVWVDCIIFPPLGVPIPPDLVIDPLFISIEMTANTVETEILELTNMGGGILNYTAEISELLDWISLNSDSGSLISEETDEIEITFNTADLLEGTYYCNILINDDLRNETVIPVTLDVLMVGNDNDLVPTITKLFGNYPNPFNPETTIRFSIKEPSHVKLEIFNIKGQKVRTLIDDGLEAKYHTVVWDGCDDSRKPVASGIYFSLFDSANGDYTSTRKMILMK